jgi:heme-degrading monooxygenase HmoA
MPLVLIRHKVANYAKWKRAVRRFARFREVSGEECFKVFRASNSLNDLTVLCRWSTPAKMKKFIKSAELRQAMKEAGVVSKPEVRFFSASEDLSAG